MTIAYPVWMVPLTVVFAVACLTQLVLLLMVWLRPSQHARREAQLPAIGHKPGVSVLVYSRNEAESLARNLPMLLEQDYPDYEVIVLDDNSCDDTQDVLNMMDQRYDRLFHTRIGRVRAMSHRKLGILLGAKAARHDILLTTHAECLPASADWISTMVQHFARPEVEVVLGPVVYERRTSFLSRFCQFDFFAQLLLLLGITLAVRPYAGWGQNLAFRKETFYANRSQGFQRHLKMQPGEDDLFVADVARRGNVAVECRPASLVTDQSRPQFIAWSIDRLNRGFTSRLYAWAPQVVKGIDGFTRYLTVLPGLALIAYTLFIIVGNVAAPAMVWTLMGVTVAMLLLRMGLMVYVHVTSARMLRQRAQWWCTLLFDLYMPLVDVWFRCKALLRRRSFSVGRIGLQ